MVAEQRHILESRCNGVVSKPIDFKALKHELQLWLNRLGVVRETWSPAKM